MAIVEQCNKCGRSLSECPYYNKEYVGLCQNYVKPIDNSRFFSHFLSVKGRIGRIQYLVTALIAIALYLLLFYLLGYFFPTVYGPDGYEIKNIVINTAISFIPAAALIILAGLKRCHDSGADWWYAIIPIMLVFITGLLPLMIGAAAFFFLFFQKSEEGLNEHGSEPLKPYLPQIEWQDNQIE